MDEDAVAKRFLQSSLTVPQCADRFGISRVRVRKILDSRGIKYRRPEPDKDKIIAAYQRCQSAAGVRLVTGFSDVTIQRVLDEAGIERNPGTVPSLLAPSRASRQTVKTRG